MEIVNFKEQYLSEMAKLYAKCYSEDEKTRKWSKEKAEKSLELSLKYFSDFSFVALDPKGVCMGGIFCLVNPYYSGEVLFVTSIQVKPEYRKQEVGKALLKNAIKVAKKKYLQESDS